MMEMILVFSIYSKVLSVNGLQQYRQCLGMQSNCPATVAIVEAAPSQSLADVVVYTAKTLN